MRPLIRGFLALGSLLPSQQPAPRSFARELRLEEASETSANASAGDLDKDGDLDWTEEVRMPLAACVPLQLAGDGTLVGWKILEAQPLRLRRVTLEGAPGIELELAGRTIRARRS